MVYHDGIVTSYAYGADGLRTQKTYGDTTYNYYYADGQLIRQTWGTHYIDFLYDETGSVYSIINDGTQYYFVKNLQGDVVQIRSIYGTVVVEYTYDAWGNVLSITGMYADTLGVNNPIRYRGYYQDFETGFYYLQSRYYDPAVRRFINADSVLHNSFLGYNQYAYCYNSPIAYVDTNGNSAQAAFEVWTTGAAPLSAVDGLLPIGDIIYWGGVLILGAIYIFSIVTADNPPLTYEKVDVKVEEKEKEIAKTVPPLTGTLIYRYNGTNIGNLVPKEKDIQTGLSFFTVPPTNGRPYFVTTIEALNSSGVLVAVQDSPIHVSVRPRGATMRDWIDAGKYSIWTHTVYYLSIKCRG